MKMESPRCQYILPKKKRQCRIQAKVGEKYCGEHAIHDERRMEERIVCPNDPRHTVSVRELEKHLKSRCGSRAGAGIADNAAWLNVDANTVKGEVKAHHQIDLRPEEEDLRRVEAIIDRLFEDGILNAPTLEVQRVAAIESELANAGQNRRKHLAQLSSLVGHIHDQFLRPSTSSSDRPLVVELGAGQGQLAYWIATLDPLQKLLLVDRAGSRQRFENRLEKEDRSERISRLRVSIEHVRLSGVPIVESCTGGILALCKHLCGAATDSALRCLATAKEDGVKIVGVALAACCHHRCRLEELVGREFLSEIGLDDAMSFAALRHISTWATCGLRIGQESGAEYERRRRLGRRAKQIFEEARNRFIRQRLQLESVRLLYYVEESVSPENLLILSRSATNDE